MGGTKAMSSHQLTAAPLPRVTTLRCSVDGAEAVSTVCGHRQVVPATFLGG